MTTDKPLKIGDYFQHREMNLQVKAVPEEGNCCSGCVADSGDHELCSSLPSCFPANWPTKRGVVFVLVEDVI